MTTPNILAHAQMITPDVGATSSGLLAMYLFWKWLLKPCWWLAVLSGGALGLALLTKMTMVLFPFIWAGLWVFYRFSDESEHDFSTSARNILLKAFPQSCMLAVMMLIALFVLNWGYGFEGTGQRLGKFAFVSRTLTGGEAPVANCFADSWIGTIPVPLPSNYVIGVDVQKKDFEAKHLSYLRGELRDRGWWYYYLYALVIKVPIGTWLLVLLAIGSWARGCSTAPSLKDSIVLIVPALTILIFVSAQTGFNHHMRYVLPIFPFVFIWTSCALRGASGFTVPGTIVGWAIGWTIASCMWIYPHSLSYFNELVGGPRNGHKHLIDSNIDWGQDLLQLKRWMETHPSSEPLNVAFFGFCDPLHTGIEYRLPPKCAGGQVILKPGWYAVSVNLMRGYAWYAPNGQGQTDYLPRDAVSYFQQLTPTSRVGYSIYIYRITRTTKLFCKRMDGLEAP